ncbi:uncharacterized protein [Aristolochia californica]|uniref:uncharacterized protein n=1 Tax=Aristolochia californica TaxID=171875 RepID=UPI0035D9763D
MSDVTASDFMVAVEDLVDSGLNEGGPGGTPGKAADVDLEWNAGSSSAHSAGSSEGCSEPAMKAECRICQDEDYVENLEAPCGCNGTLKVQCLPVFYVLGFSSFAVWRSSIGVSVLFSVSFDCLVSAIMAFTFSFFSCRVVGIAECMRIVTASRSGVPRKAAQDARSVTRIPDGIYTPGYTAPPRAAEFFAIEIRQSWAAHVGRNGAFDRDFEEEEDPEDDDEGRDFGPTFAGISCCRAAAVALMLILFIHHLFMVLSNTSLLQDPETYLNVSDNVNMLDLLDEWFAGFLLPLYCMGKFARLLYRRRVRRNRQAAAAAAAAAEQRSQE